MCQRKIITKEKEWTVPLLNGCHCPMIKEFRHINHESELQNIPNSRPRRSYSLPNHCYDIHTSIPITDVPDHHVVFRNCVCNHFSGICMKLPPLLYQVDRGFDEDGEELINDDSDENDETSFDGNVGIRPRN